MERFTQSIVLLMSLGLVAPSPARAVVCENCFAVFAIPDTQLYTTANPPFEFQP